MEVLAAPSGAPGVSVLGRPSALVLSLSHAHGRAVAGLAASRTRLGFDLERVEERPAAFLGDWFTDAEQRLVATSAEPPLAATLVWSGKEAVMKALREGLRIPPKAVEVSPEEGPADGAWRALAARGPGGERWRGWWRAEAGFVLCVVADPPSGPPRRIG